MHIQYLYFMFLSMFTIIVGTFAGAIYQTKLKRILAYSECK